MDELTRQRWADLLEQPSGQIYTAGWYGAWRPGEKAAVAELLSRQQDGRCWYCGDPVGMSGATIEHLIPRSQGGPRRALWNLRLTHRSCNESHGCQSWARKHEASALHEGPVPDIPDFEPEPKRRGRHHEPLATLADVFPPA